MAKRFLWVLRVGVALLAWSSMAIAEKLEPPALVLASVYHDDVELRDYWVSEKLDGARAYWDGRQLFFRSGRPVPAPAWFTQGFPTQPLDGELWIGRGQFDRLSGIVRKAEPIDAEWQQLSYMVFELPGAGGTFSERQDAMRTLLEKAGVPWLRVVEQSRLADRSALGARLAAVVAAGGEGLMLHRAVALYAAGRSEDLIKLKPYLDREATVIAHLPGQGRNAGRLGALLVEDDGRRFRLGSGFSDAQRNTPPALGSRVTYRYRGLTSKGLPRFPVFLRIREDF